PARARGLPRPRGFPSSCRSRPLLLLSGVSAPHMIGISLIGSTGSVGVSTLDIVGRNPHRFRVVALGAGRNLEELVRQVQLFRPQLVSSTEPEAAAFLRARLGSDCPELKTGPEAAVAVATHPEADILVSAIVGAAGMLPTYRAIEMGKTIALA